MKAVLFLALLTLALLTSCLQGGGSAYQEVNYRTGNEGLSLTFVENAPTNIIDEESTFPVRAQVQNQGAYDIMSEKQENVYVTVIKDNYFVQGSTEGYTPPFGLRGKSNAYPNGQTYILDLGMYKASTIPGNFEKPQTPILITACYPYQTKLVQDICIDTNAQNKRVQSCTSQASYTYSGQGAPVVITKVEPDMQQLKGGYIRPSFRIYVDNKGKGHVISPKPLFDSKTPEQACTAQQAQRDEIDNIQITAYLSDLQLDCRDAGVPDYLDIGSKENSIRCYVTDEALQKEPNRFGNRDNYQTTLRVELDYYYMITDEKKVNIRHVQTFKKDITQNPNLQAQCPFPWQFSDKGECVNKCDYCGNLEAGKQRPDFCTSKPILGQTYDIISGFKCACTALNGPGSFDDLFKRETSYYDGNLKQFKPFKLAIQGDLCPDDYGCCRPVDCSNYQADSDGCGLQPECTYCPQTTETKKASCYNAQNLLSDEERTEQICKAHCGERTYYNSFTRTCEKQPKEKDLPAENKSTATTTPEKKPTTPPAKETPPAETPTNPLPFKTLQVNTANLIDDSPSGSYDLQLQDNGELNVPIPSPFKGIVQQTITTPTPTYGNVVELRGSQNIWRFAHLKEIQVKEGELVQQGQSLGIQGNTGHTQGPTGIHVHIEIHRKAPTIGNPTRITDRSITEPLIWEYINYIQGGPPVS